MTAKTARPAVDPELAELYAALPAPVVLDLDVLPHIRPYSSAPVEPLLEGRPIRRRELTVTAADGAALALSIFSPAGADRARPAVLWLHGGGMVMGDRFAQIDIPLEWLEQLDVVVASVEYRLAPEVRGDTLVEDAYAALSWLAREAEELGIDPARLVVAGTSAGGGLAAGVALLARERDLPVRAQVLLCPMLDHRNVTVSSAQFTAPDIWSRETNAFAWGQVLEGIDQDEVPAAVSPARAADLSGLPDTYLDAGSAETFRDEVVDYASRIWAAGGDAELHVWGGGFHGFDAVFPQADLSRRARAARIDWLRRRV
ncbi:alpha/beta hydrolase [Xylanimonas oleitrophica]|uniref:Alpha/beta hydrolase n=1 Tax=Xylanimonas oleitrophica TaxID=2607479 RepID=A0A2W5X3M5_9MICO|nr:alpha/beta hydrolase fold domain-containing protein [Xylanimonas oleitrophica]PZR55005.1 alpha/beta hydrolase [Xylanimonas oleitrophica]